MTDQIEDTRSERELLIELVDAVKTIRTIAIVWIFAVAVAALFLFAEAQNGSDF